MDAVLIERSEGALHFLASEADEKNLLRCRFVKFALVGMDDPQTCDLAMDDSYNAGQSFSYDDRNAGAIVESKDGRILPTQSSTATAYGVSMAFRDVQKMSMTGSPVTKTENISIIGWNGKKLTGVHTYAQSNQFEVIDIRYVKYCPESIMPKIRKKLRKIQERIVSAK